MNNITTPFLCDSEASRTAEQHGEEGIGPEPAPEQTIADGAQVQVQVEAVEQKPTSRIKGAFRRVPLWPLFALGAAAVMGILYFGQSLLAPLTVAAFVALFFSPIVMRLRKLGLPESVGAAIVVMFAVAVLWVLANAIREPAKVWLESWPHAKSVLASRLVEFNRYIQFDTNGSDAMVSGFPAESESDTLDFIGGMPTAVQYILGSLSSIASSSFMIILATYAFLASGDGFLRKLVAILPTLSDKKRLVEIVSYLKRDLGRFWWTTGWINAGLGVVACLAFLSMGLPSALLWGVMVAILNFIPIVGPLVCTLILSIASILAFDEWNRILSVPLAYLILHTLESQFITPHILGHRLKLNPTVVILAILFWSSLWGILGTFIAVPFLICLKIVCSHISRLHAISDFLE